MAASDTTSSAAGWAALGRRSIGHPLHLAPPFFGTSSESIVVTAASSPTASGIGGSTARSGGTEGRVARPARRRSRASRRTPVTLLNTDTTNFRAMVQQFTGFPSEPHSSSYPPGSGLSYSDPQTTMPPLVHFPQPQYVEQPFQPHHRLHHHHHQQQQPQYQFPAERIFRVDRSSNSDGSQNDAFLQGLHNSGTGMEMADVFLFGGMPSHLGIRPTSTDTRVDDYSS